MQQFKAVNHDFSNYVSQAVLSMPAARLLGFKFRSIEPGHVEIEQPRRKELSQHNGYFQGGIIGALIDFAGGSAAGTLLPQGWVNMTIDYSVKLLAPAAGERIIARGRVIHAAKATTVSAADIFISKDGRETLCATGLVTMRNIQLKAQDDP